MDTGESGIGCPSPRPAASRRLARRKTSPMKADCRRCADAIIRAHPSALSILEVHRVILCPTCGHKRCPKATDHNNKCTGSNEAGQVGSDYR